VDQQPGDGVGVTVVDLARADGFDQVVVGTQLLVLDAA